MTISELRAQFWASLPAELASQQRTRKRQNDYSATIRSAWVDFVDQQHRAGILTDSQADRATL